MRENGRQMQWNAIGMSLRQSSTCRAKVKTRECGIVIKRGRHVFARIGRTGRVEQIAWTD